MVQRGRQRGDDGAGRARARARATPSARCTATWARSSRATSIRRAPFRASASGAPDGRRPEPEALLHRLACQLLGKDEGFSRGVERSFHYGYLAPEQGILHVGMISHLGSMIPVAAGCAFALKEHGERPRGAQLHRRGRHLDRRLPRGPEHGRGVEAAARAGDREQPLRVLDAGVDCSTPPARWPTAVPATASPAEVVDGNDPDAMADALARAVARARAGEGPTLLEAMLGRMRGHAEGDGSLKVVPRRGAAALPRRRSGAGLRAAPRGRGRAESPSCVSGSTSGRTNWSRRLCRRGPRRAASGAETAPRARLRHRSGTCAADGRERRRLSGRRRAE